MPCDSRSSLKCCKQKSSLLKVEKKSAEVIFEVLVCSNVIRLMLTPTTTLCVSSGILCVLNIEKKRTAIGGP